MAKQPIKIKPYTPLKLPLKEIKFSFSLLKKAKKAIAQHNLLISQLSSKEKEKRIIKESKQTLDGHNPIFTKEAIDFLCDHLPKKIDQKLACKIHGIIQQDSLEKGKIRKRQNWIGEEGSSIEKAWFLPPKASLLASFLKNLFLYAEKKEEEPLIQIALFFAQFLLLHPFMNGNGRVARLLATTLFFQKKITTEISLFLGHYFKKHRLEYNRRLFAISEENDWENWIHFFLKAIIAESFRKDSAK